MQGNRIPKKTTPSVSDQDLKGFIAHIVTTGSVAVIETWLRQSARGRWKLKAEGMDGELNAMKYSVRFLDKDDYSNFRTRFTRRKDS